VAKKNVKIIEDGGLTEFTDNFDRYTDSGGYIVQYFIPNVTYPPSPITSLKGKINSDNTIINLKWIAPGNQENVGIVTKYIIKWNTIPIINNDVWDISEEIKNTIKPLIAGSEEIFSFYTNQLIITNTTLPIIFSIKAENSYNQTSNLGFYEILYYHESSPDNLLFIFIVILCIFAGVVFIIIGLIYLIVKLITKTDKYVEVN